MTESAGLTILIIILLVIYFRESIKFGSKTNNYKVLIYGIHFRNKKIIDDLKLFNQLYNQIIKIYYEDHHKPNSVAQIVFKPTDKFPKFRPIIYIDFPEQIYDSRENAIIKLRELKNNQQKYKLLSEKIITATDRQPIIYIFVFYYSNCDISKVDYVIEQIY